jgi:type VI secretion system secreted protein VgrG
MSVSIPGTPHLSVRVASGDALDVRHFSVEERMSTLFTVALVVLCQNENVDFDLIVGQPASFTLGHGLTERTWTGIASHFYQLHAVEAGASTYQLTIVPSLWLATQRRNYRIFQQMTEPDVARKVLREWDVDPEVEFGASYKKRKYRVQYAESDYAFICRMFEDAGVSFYFREVSGTSKLVLTDAPQAAEAHEPIAYRDAPTDADRQHITHVRIGQRVLPGKYTIRDHDHRLPSTYKLVRSATRVDVSVEERLEQYHYAPGAFLFGVDKGEDTPHADDKGKSRTDEMEGDALAQKRLDAKRSSAKVCTFETNAHSLAAGTVVTFLDHPRAELAPGKRWLIVSSVIAGAHDEKWIHTCEARSAALPYRPDLVTPKPKAGGAESATVVGPPGDEIHTDEFGRVRVHFHWDRESKMDDNSSCWVHVSQPWGGAGYGMTNLPRVGQEVLVDFLGGDPDRPIIVGRVYTNLQKTPYKLPENKTQSGWKSNSTGGTGGYNEIMFEDASGKELLRMQAEKDMQKLVKHNEESTVGRDRTRIVKRNESVTVGGNRTKRIKLNEQQAIGLNQTVTVGVNRSMQVGVTNSTVVGDTHVVIISPPGEGESGSTSLVMKDNKITLSTSAGAQIVLDGPNITIQSAAGGDVIIKGGPMVKINA